MELLTSEERWRSLLNNPIFGVTFLDENQRFITTSRTFQNIVGYSDEELRQLTPLDISVPGERSFETRAIRSAKGIPIAPALMRGLDQLASELGVAKLG